MTGPGDEIAAGRGHMRASFADREHAIGVLKAAYVQGMLAKDEVDLRVGQTLASRTYADLASVTADLPAGITAIQPRQPARTQDGQKVLRPGRWIATATAGYAGACAYALFLILHHGEDQPAYLLIVGGFLVYLGILIVSVGAIIANWQDKRSDSQPPRWSPGAGDQDSERPVVAIAAERPPAD